ncbi:MAG: hypothetical protein Q8Q50_05440 [Methylobacter sp.]|jgi:hypothetical protein|nr:hypothetical protein [Methylobacter sp.]
MKINKGRLFLRIIVTASLVFLTGFDNAPLAETVTVKEEQSITVKSTQKEKKTKRSVSSIKSSDDEKAQPQKSLDLSIPFKLPEKSEHNKHAQQESSSIFSAKKDKSTALSLDGQMLMSQEPEADKQKSVDGAGIVINLKR